MSDKRKIAVVITARPSYSRIKTALDAIRNTPGLQLDIVLSASTLLERYGRVETVIEKDGFQISERIYSVIEGHALENMSKTTAISLLELSSTFARLKPDVVVTIADRYETIATAIAAAYQNIPLVHIQGGEVTGSIDEKVRHAVSKLSDFHLVSSEKAMERLIKMGENENNISVTGCPSLDIAREVLEAQDDDFNPFSKYSGVGPVLDYDRDYIVVMQHPVTTEYSSAFSQIQETLDAVHKLDLPTIWFWPNIDAGSDAISKSLRLYREKNPNNRIHFFKNMDGVDFLRVIKKSKCLIGNSSVGIRESSFLGIPVVNIGNRQSGREKASNVLSIDYDKAQIKEAILKQIKHGSYIQSNLYGDGYSAQRIADYLLRMPLTFKKRLTY